VYLPRLSIRMSPHSRPCCFPIITLSLSRGNPSPASFPDDVRPQLRAFFDLICDQNPTPPFSGLFVFPAWFSPSQMEATRSVVRPRFFSNIPPPGQLRIQKAQVCGFPPPLGVFRCLHDRCLFSPPFGVGTLFWIHNVPPRAPPVFLGGLFFGQT